MYRLRKASQATLNVFHIPAPEIEILSEYRLLSRPVIYLSVNTQNTSAMRVGFPPVFLLVNIRVLNTV